MKLFQQADFALRSSTTNQSTRSRKHRTGSAVLFCILALVQIDSRANEAHGGDLFAYEAVYSGRYLGFNIELERQLKQRDPQRWQLTHKFSNLWIKIFETSAFDATKQRIIADHYEYQRKGIGKNRHLEIQFDQQNKKVNIKRKDRHKQFDINAEVLDKLNYQVALRQALLTDPNLKSFSTRIADRSRVKNYRIVYDGSETLSTQLGKVNAVRFRRDREDDDGDISSSTIIWMVPEWQYLPARIRQIEDGKKYTLEIQSLKVGNPPQNSALEAFKR